MCTSTLRTNKICHREGTAYLARPRPPTCTHCMVQYTLDGGRSRFWSFDRLHKRISVVTTLRSLVVTTEIRL
eukprot:COSAG01_NODE_1606_length_9753_cov_4.191714_1_plen_71_part_10